MNIKSGFLIVAIVCAMFFMARVFSGDQSTKR
jgi:hypothetical protein